MPLINLRKVGSMTWIALCFFLTLGLVVLGLLFAWSPGKPQPFLDENGQPLAGSLSEKNHIEINGVEQGMFIKSKDIHNPVLLFVHGGPGMPEYWMTQRYSLGREAARQEQGGAGEDHAQQNQ